MATTLTLSSTIAARPAAIEDGWFLADCSYELPHELRRNDYIAMGGVMLRVTSMTDDGLHTFARVADGRKFAVDGAHVLRLKRKEEA